MLAALRERTLDVVWTYESTARAAGLRWLNLGPSVDLGSDAESARYDSAAAVVTVNRPAPAVVTDSSASVPGVDSIVVRGAPLRYALTIPNESANLALAERFVRFLFSTDGQRILRAGMFDLIDPLVVTGSDVPEPVAAVADSVAEVPTADGSSPSSRP
jgi:ABC-type molybdate transport system substrate-binding protein